MDRLRTCAVVDRAAMSKDLIGTFNPQVFIVNHRIARPRPFLISHADSIIAASLPITAVLLADDYDFRWGLLCASDGVGVETEVGFEAPTWREAQENAAFRLLLESECPAKPLAPRKTKPGG